MGVHLLGFQIGNEDDRFHAMLESRDASYTFDAYFKEYREFVVALRTGEDRSSAAGSATYCGGIEDISR